MRAKDLASLRVGPEMALLLRYRSSMTRKFESCRCSASHQGHFRPNAASIDIFRSSYALHHKPGSFIPTHLPVESARIILKDGDHLPMTLSELAAAIGAELAGDPTLQVDSASTLEEARPGQVSF